MTELLVPFSIALALAQVCRDARWRAILYVGVCLPDSVRSLLLLQGGSPAALAHPLHSPVGVAAWCFAMAFLFEEQWRARAFGALLSGAWIHLAVDAMAAPAGSDLGVFWAFPVSGSRLELGWIPVLPPWILRTGSAVVVAVIGLGSVLGRRRPAG